MSQWSADRALAGVKGPLLSIRNPHWTEANPWQDIPIMIFTNSQWSFCAARLPTAAIVAIEDSAGYLPATRL
ncbi:MAG TPA: hypothetical protein VGF88_12015 [Acidobacteriaceae bacterium]|jgi:hypothetical protein